MEFFSTNKKYIGNNNCLEKLQSWKDKSILHYVDGVKKERKNKIIFKKYSKSCNCTDKIGKFNIMITHSKKIGKESQKKKIRK